APQFVWVLHGCTWQPLTAKFYALNGLSSRTAFCCRNQQERKMTKKVKLKIPATATIDREKGIIEIEYGKVPPIYLSKTETITLNFEPLLQELPPKLVLSSSERH